MPQTPEAAQEMLDAEMQRVESLGEKLGMGKLIELNGMPAAATVMRQRIGQLALIGRKILLPSEGGSVIFTFLGPPDRDVQRSLAEIAMTIRPASSAA